MERTDMMVTETERRFMEAQAGVENLQREVDIRKFALLKTLCSDAVMRPLGFENFSGPLLFDRHHPQSR